DCGTDGTSSGPNPPRPKKSRLQGLKKEGAAPKGRARLPRALAFSSGAACAEMRWLDGVSLYRGNWLMAPMRIQSWRLKPSMNHNVLPASCRQKKLGSAGPFCVAELLRRVDETSAALCCG